jgi:hypothetical protein
MTTETYLLFIPGRGALDENERMNLKMLAWELCDAARRLKAEGYTMAKWCITMSKDGCAHIRVSS